MRAMFLILFNLGLLSVFIAAGHAEAATLTVNTTADELNTNGQCSLREAIFNINNGATTYPDCTPSAAYGTGDTINIPAGTYTIAIPGGGEELNATGDYDILKSVSIVGAGSSTTTINGGGLDRVFHIDAVEQGYGASVSVSVSGVTITGGSAIGVYGGGIHNFGTLTITNSIIIGNTAAGSVYGGGIYNVGTLTLTNSTISGNTTEGGGGVFNGGTATITNATITLNTASNSGGGIQNGGTLTLTNSTISSNAAANTDGYVGGGIYIEGGTATITNSTITGNTGHRGGGIFNTDRLTVTNSTISENTAYGTGGGIYNFGTLTLAGSTLSGNSATQGTGWGGGLFVDTGTASLANVTVSGNQAKGGAGVWAQPGTTTSFESCSIVDNLNIELSSGAGICGNGGPAISMHNTIFSNNRNNIGSDNCYQAGLSLGYNISSDSSCGAFINTGDMQNTDPLLEPLQDNGGPTFTHALLDGSPALDAADPNNFPEADQRGIARPQGSRPDIGAHEKVAQTGPLADLTGSWYEPLKVSCKAKKEGLVCKVKGKLIIRNIGELNATETLVRFYISDDESYDNGDILLREKAVERLHTSKERKISIKLNLPEGVNPGGKYIIAHIDADNATEESDEENNFVLFGPMND